MQAKPGISRAMDDPDHSPSAWSRWSVRIAGALVVLAVIAAYRGALGGPFLLDDIPGIERNPSIRSWTASLQPPAGTTVSGRPVANATLALNWALSGERVWSYHVLNLAIHAAAALVLFGLVRRTLRLPSLRGRYGPVAETVALLAALAWALHPLQSEAVAYIVQRVESLMGLCYLLTLYAFVRGAGEQRPGTWRAISVASCALGMATKEVMVTAPLMVFLYDRTFVAGGWRAAWSGRKAYYVSLAGTWLLLAALVAGTHGRAGTAGFATGITAWTYLLTQCQAIVHYLRLVFWPAPLIFDYGFGTVRGLGEVWAPGLLLAGFGGATVVGLWRQPVAAFPGAWFFGTLAASSSFVPIASQTVAEHRMYLALAAPVIVVLLGLARWLGRRALWLAAAWPVVLGGLTVARIHDYRTAESIWLDTVAKQPANPRAYGNLAHAYIDAGRWQEALAASRRELQIAPDYRGDAPLNLGRALTELGRPAEALPFFEEALHELPDSFDVRNNFGVALAALGRWPEAVAQYEAALRLRPDFAEAENNLANALAKSDRLDDAQAHYAAALRLQPAFAEAESNWGRTLAEAGRIAEALPHLERALQLRPGGETHAAFAGALAAAGRPEEAIPHFEAALRAQPGNATARFGLGNALARVGRLPEAAACFAAAVRLRPEDAAAQHNLGMALLQLGRAAEAVAPLEAAVHLLPDSAAARHELALALGELGRRTEAEAQDEAALRLQPDFAEARDHLRWLRQQ